MMKHIIADNGSSVFIFMVMLFRAMCWELDDGVSGGALGMVSHGVLPDPITRVRRSKMSV